MSLCNSIYLDHVTLPFEWRSRSDIGIITIIVSHGINPNIINTRMTFVFTVANIYIV